MIIPIDDKYRVRSDTQCWMIDRIGGINKDGERVWNAIKFYQNPGNAIKGLANLQIRTTNTETLEDSIEAIQKICDKFNKILKAYSDGKEVK